MSTKDTNATPEQAKPADVRQPADRKKHRDEEFDCTLHCPASRCKGQE